jgi:pimeloyl-ACP methyl ester carboxylesterase
VTTLLINGHTLNVDRYGLENAPTVVLLHHGLGSVRAWKEQIPLLEQSGYQVVAYDRWGYGASEIRPSLDVPTFGVDLGDLYAILKEFHLQRVALVGHSDGGTIALYFSAFHPGAVWGMVTVAAHIYVETRMQPGILDIKHTFDHDERFKSGLRIAHGDKYESTFRNWFDGWYHLSSLSWDMRPLLSKIRCPALVVQGEVDEHASSQHAKDIAKGIQGSELWLVPGAGHMLPQEQAGIFNARLSQFLDMHRV